MRTLTRAAAAVGSAALAVTMLGAPARAEVYGIDDPVDVEGWPSDIHAMSVRHSAERVVVKVWFDDLRRKNDAGMNIYLVTDRSSDTPDYVLGTGLSDGTDYHLSPAEGWKAANVAPVDCSYELRLLWRRDIAKARIDRACLDDPKWLRASVKVKDLWDASHPLVDWSPGRKAWSLPLKPA